MIQFITHDVDMPVFDKTKIAAWIKSVAAVYAKKTGDISYVFCSDAHILSINNHYLAHDYYTDIITFDYSAGVIISGDIFISLDTVRSNAAALKIEFNDELHRIIIHGILHLCGNDDKTPTLRAEMTKKENLALAMLK